MTDMADFCDWTTRVARKGRCDSGSRHVSWSWSHNSWACPVCTTCTGEHIGKGALGRTARRGSSSHISLCSQTLLTLYTTWSIAFITDCFNFRYLLSPSASPCMCTSSLSESKRPKSVQLQQQKMSCTKARTRYSPSPHTRAHALCLLGHNHKSICRNQEWNRCRTQMLTSSEALDLCFCAMQDSKYATSTHADSRNVSKGLMKREVSLVRLCANRGLVTCTLKSRSSEPAAVQSQQLKRSIIMSRCTLKND